MAKIFELTNQQLLANIDKYKKIIDQLYAERDKRVGAGKPETELYTQEELFEIKKNRAKQQEQDQFSLNLAEDDIEEIESVHKANNQNDEEDEKDLVRVTTLLRLSKDQMAEIQNAKSQSEKKKVVARRPKKKVK